MTQPRTRHRRYWLQKQHKEALAAYARASDFYLGAKLTKSSDRCLLRNAHFFGMHKRYDEAVAIYETVAKHMLLDNLTFQCAKGRRAEEAATRQLVWRGRGWQCGV